MKRDSVVAIVDGLNQNQVRYLIVGGLAVVAHGYVRFTADVDLLLSVQADNLKRAWAEEKNMTVFSLFSDIHPATEIDLFLEPPIDFDGAYARAIRKEVASGTIATFCSLSDLIELKTLSDRPVDREDIEKLKLFLEDSDD
jgi:hypothetical protein